MQDTPSFADEPYCYLTTRGRVTGNDHAIEYWFAASGRTLYILAGNHRSDWVLNLQRHPVVTVRVATTTYGAIGRVVEAPDEDALARRLLLEKYTATYSGDLTDWGRTALPVAIDLDLTQSSDST